MRGPSASLGTGRFIIFKFNIIGYKKGSGSSFLRPYVRRQAIDARPQVNYDKDSSLNPRPIFL